MLTISTEYLSEHKDFDNYEDLEEYLGSVTYYDDDWEDCPGESDHEEDIQPETLLYVDSGTVDTMSAVKEAVAASKSSIVLPVANDDLTINFKYE